MTSLCFACLALGVVLGWVVASRHPNQIRPVDAASNLRQNGEKFTSPLLLADVGTDTDSPALAGLKQQVQNVVDDARGKGSITIASIYVRDLKSGNQININPNEKYFPASLTKIPLMISYFHQDEQHPGLLDTRGKLDFQTDYNAGQEIKPAKVPVSGQEYSLNDLIEMMIKYSDNISFNLLITRPGAEDSLKSLYSDFHLYYPFDQTTVTNVRSPQDYSLFLRTLYNATYLNVDDSEKALRLLSESDFKVGIVAGVPKNVVVAHKYGLATQMEQGVSGQVALRQLHDCGIVYQPNNPYLICIMTKSHADLPTVEHVIRDISKKVYTEVGVK